ncbi:hypothetical protein EAI_09472 [Harpegnathos saltator]|uniref:Uncharacterized protein n=1 Tax=Harpegnathos saltator TaxID=610380 RepID=E2BY28_HARSA|nr:hypothetical protein EAI_09472 [Harpegnathos saltator]
MLFGVGVLDGQGSPAPNGLPRSVKLSVVVLPGRSTLDATSMPPPQPKVLAAKLADDVALLQDDPAYVHPDALGATRTQRCSRYTCLENPSRSSRVLVSVDIVAVEYAGKARDIALSELPGHHGVASVIPLVVRFVH